MILNVFKVLAPGAITFFIGIALTPFLTDFLYRHKLWKKRAGKVDPFGQDTPIFNELHKEKETGTPRMGGIIIWASTLMTVLLFWLLSVILPGDLAGKLNFLSRSQTWLPLFMMLIGSVVGLLDDWLLVRDSGEKAAPAGLSFQKRLFVVLALALLGGCWFYLKLRPEVALPFYGNIDIGFLIIPLFMLVMIGLFTSGVIDGLDGLAGGVMAIIFAAYAPIAFFQHQYDLAALCTAISGAILAFLWFNIPPARFYMSETGMLGLTVSLTVIAFLTNSVFWLPLIACPLTITVLANVIQLASKKYRGKKVFLVAPLHHHFEALGWPSYKVVMRYWVISVVAAILGIILTLVSK